MDDKRVRKSIRLPGFDYTTAAQYYLTLCTFCREPLLGRFENSSIILSEIGEMVEACWNRIGLQYINISFGSYVIMPNHFHAIVRIQEPENDYDCKPSLPDIVRNFKAFTGHELKSKYYYLKLWQRGYYEHIIRDQAEYVKIDRYIKNNPATWLRDKYYWTAQLPKQ